MGLPLLGTMIQGGMGLYNMMQGGKKMQNIASNMPSQESLRQPFEKSQGLIDRMTNFNQYSGQAMDLATQEGNQGVENAMMQGMGGSQANAIKNRMKRSSLTGVYDKFNQGLGQAASLQGGIDRNISGQMFQNQGEARNINMGLAGTQMGVGANIMGGAEGMQKFGAGLGSGGATALQGMGGLLGKLFGG